MAKDITGCLSLHSIARSHRWVIWCLIKIFTSKPFVIAKYRNWSPCSIASENFHVLGCWNSDKDVKFITIYFQLNQTVNQVACFMSQWLGVTSCPNAWKFWKMLHSNNYFQLWKINFSFSNCDPLSPSLRSWTELKLSMHT